MVPIEQPWMESAFLFPCSFSVLAPFTASDPLLTLLHQVLCLRVTIWTLPLVPGWVKRGPCRRLEWGGTVSTFPAVCTLIISVFFPPSLLARKSTGKAPIELVLGFPPNLAQVSFLVHFSTACTSKLIHMDLSFFKSCMVVFSFSFV